MTYSTLLFDFDHTLFDSDGCEAEAFAQTLDRFGIDEVAMHFAAYELINQGLWRAVERGELQPGHVRTERFVRFAAEMGLEADPLAMADEFAHGMGTHGDLYPGAEAILERLAESVTLGLITNGITQIQRARIERLDIDRYFDAIAISEEVGSSKPGTEIFDALFARLGRLPRETALIIGDSLASDMRGGANYGIATCWYNPHGHEATGNPPISHEIRELEEVLSLVDLRPGQ